MDSPASKNKTNKIRKLRGFTLVELIITISILVILGTISIVSIQNFYESSRDSVRVSDLKSLHQGLSLFQIKSGIYPLPEDSIEVTGNGMILSYQGDIGESISRIININKLPLDPKDATKYAYAVDKDRKKAQLMGYLESGDGIEVISYDNIIRRLVNETYADDTDGVDAVDYQNRFIYVTGDKVGVLTDENKVPIEETIIGTGINLSETNTGYIAYFGGDSYGAGKSTGTGDILVTQIIGALTNTIPCNPLTYSGYTISALAHNETKIFTKPLTISNGTGTGSLEIQCINGTLDTEHAIETPSITCADTFVNNGSNACVSDICGNAPDFSISNGIQKYNIIWTHNINGGGNCTFVCQAGYYWNNTACIAASQGYFVANSGSITQVTCNNSNTYQDITGQTSCKTVSPGYYSTPTGGGILTGQTQCEANNYCVNGVKTVCTTGYSSIAGSTSCTLNTYTVSGGFGTNANGATINVCGTNITADASGNFTTTRNYNSTCNTITATRTNYTCSTSTNGPVSLVSNVSNIAGNCTANTQTYTCTAKPAIGTLWNTVASYTQTWNGSVWTPANTTTAYNATASTTSCNYKCDTNYTWNGTSCTANTQTYTCAAKPATGTLWNTVASYTQTWNGSVWLPVNTATTYNATVSTTSCNYKCDTNYTWNGTFCVLASYPGCNTADIILTNGQVWAACNLGTNTAGFTVSSYGSYYQWGRNDTGWTAGWTTDNWGLGGQGPCAVNYHVPTLTEWNAAIVTLGTNTQTVLLLSLAGDRSVTDGSLVNQGQNGIYWTSYTSWGDGYDSFSQLGNANTSISSSFKYWGHSVRCIHN
ncbi:MAG: prepilin-type N-terminal cleavage/methylation domain-containing protein [Candidatus Gracilibacteria bacterium]|nr:prepilin-type N-terminal cleavage/methylation domain-containing protein [Candidatus Gracilibacteria bacterium]